MRKIHCYLRGHRRNWSLTQEELAALLGSYRARVSEVELGKAPPKASELIGYAFIFGCTPQSIFPAYAAEVQERILSRAGHLVNGFPDESPRVAQRKTELIHNLRFRMSDNSQTV